MEGEDNREATSKPEDMQKCIDRTSKVCKLFLEVLCKATGMVRAVVVGGPEPQDGGHLNGVAYVH
ncbi:hypothetical protein PM082_002327 [Marasmius tenuissimus]|nr:hypothetical protein PM082_002327 [Marasmius tenuissimus]